MSTTAIVVIVVVIIVVAALVVGLMMAQRRRRLQQRFGPEYDRLVDEHDSKRKAEAELTQREKRVRDLDIRPLTDSARVRYADQWAALQEQFVDTPADAVSASQVLVSAVMLERGYPTDDRDQVLADLSVEHASTLGHYRAAEQISETAAGGSASTEDLRQAMIHYRALFRDLLGEPADAQDGSAAPGLVQEAAADDALLAETRDDPVAAEEPIDDTEDPAVTVEDPTDDADVDNPLQRTPRS
jgi:predicted nucleic acid-binding protein